MNGISDCRQQPLSPMSIAEPLAPARSLPADLAMSAQRLIHQYDGFIMAGRVQEAELALKSARRIFLSLGMKEEVYLCSSLMGESVMPPPRSVPHPLTRLRGEYVLKSGA